MATGNSGNAGEADEMNTENDKDPFEYGHLEPSKEVRNVQHLIKLTEDNLKELNSLKRSGLSHPPSIFFEEVEELRGKLCLLKDKEKELLDNDNGFSDNMPSVSEPDTPASSSGSPVATSPRRDSSSDTAIPSSPLRAHVRAYLPNNQRTTIKCKSGQTVLDAFVKALQIRGLTPETCVAYRYYSKTIVDWNAEISSLSGEEITVEVNEEAPASTTNISHNFVRKTFFTLAFCEACRKLLFQGFRCQTCGYRFHPRCAHEVPLLCQQSEDPHLYKKLLAVGGGMSQAQPLLTVRMTPNTPRAFGQRERSISAPNVNLISTVSAKSSPRETFRNLKPGSSHTISTNEFRKVLGQPPKQRINSVRAQDIFSPYGSLPNSPSVNTAAFDYAGSHPNQRSHSSSGPSSSSIQPSKNRHRSKSHSDEFGRKQRSARRDSNDDWEVPEGEVQVGARIGAGSYGTVYKGFWHGTVAVKMLNVKDPSPQQLQAFKNEVAVLRKTRHVNVLLFMGCMWKPYLAIITQWCEGSSLYRHLHVAETKFEMLDLINISRQTAQGMDYLHAKSIIHRDMKSNNIFLQEDLTVKIGDFGLATAKTRWSGTPEHGCEQPFGSILWMAPEVIRLQDKNPYTFMSDVYAFGVVLYELLTSSLPYTNIGNKDQIIYMVGRGYLRPDMNKIRTDCPKSFRRLLTDCIKYKREERPLFRPILANIESIMRALPKITRSISEPTLHLAKPGSDMDLIYPCPTPRTPIHNPLVFNFFSPPAVAY
ncbi:serine/threonine-protein kinase A-Raf-like isoform X2 [Rhopilema esculentum]|uniref:serine/threonine-protein kinase A-Raf-like isoform X2 n=1 Tax=Rhopilema esculentum TaxID=499914 RepID=UPI0031D098C7